MVSIGISEFSFGFAFLYEQVQHNWGNLHAAPVLPSLQQEAEQGWDAHLPVNGVDFYYQFKISDYLFLKTAVFRKDGTYHGPYYRIAYHKRNYNSQHRRLWSLGQTHPNTFYVTLEVADLNEFNAAFLSGTLISKARLFRLADCENVNDSKQHYITFQKGASKWIEHSLPKEHPRGYSGKDLRNIYGEAFQSKKQALDKDYASRLFYTVKRGVMDAVAMEGSLPFVTSGLSLLDYNPVENTRAATFLRISEVLSAFYGATLVLVGN